MDTHTHDYTHGISESALPEQLISRCVLCVRFSTPHNIESPCGWQTSPATATQHGGNTHWHEEEKDEGHVHLWCFQSSEENQW